MGNLVLSRKSGQSIVVGEPGPHQVVFKVGSVRGGTVDIRIIADDDVPVHRTEIYAKLHNGQIPVGAAEEYDHHAEDADSTRSRGTRRVQARKGSR